MQDILLLGISNEYHVRNSVTYHTIFSRNHQSPLQWNLHRSGRESSLQQEWRRARPELTRLVRVYQEVLPLPAAYHTINPVLEIGVSPPSEDVTLDGDLEAMSITKLKCIAKVG